MADSTSSFARTKHSTYPTVLTSAVRLRIQNILTSSASGKNKPVHTSKSIGAIRLVLLAVEQLSSELLYSGVIFFSFCMEQDKSSVDRTVNSPKYSEVNFLFYIYS